MIHVVTGKNRHRYADQLEQSYRLRYRVFVKERKWSALARTDERDVDQFDTEDAIYLLAIDGTTNGVVGGSRLIPTTKPYLLTDVFSRLCTKPIPRAPNTLEWGRLFVAPAHRGGHALSVTTCHIIAGIVEYCHDHDIDQLAVVSEVYLLPRFLALGLKPEPLGLPEVIDRAPTVAYTLEPSEEALAKIRAVHGFTRPSIVSAGRQLRRVPVGVVT